MGMLLYLAVNFALLHRACLDILLQWVIKYFNTASVFLQATPNSWSDQEAQSAYHPSKPCRNPSIQMQKKKRRKEIQIKLRTDTKGTTICCLFSSPLSLLRLLLLYYTDDIHPTDLWKEKKNYIKKSTTPLSHTLKKQLILMHTI